MSVTLHPQYAQIADRLPRFSLRMLLCRYDWQKHAKLLVLFPLEGTTGNIAVYFTETFRLRSEEYGQGKQTEDARKIFPLLLLKIGDVSCLEEVQSHLDLSSEYAEPDHYAMVWL